MSQYDGVMIENVTSPRNLAGLDNGTEYHFLVTAILGADQTDQSNEVVAVPQETVPVTGELDDTGISRSMDSFSGQASFCDPDHPAGQDSQHGRDALAHAEASTFAGHNDWRLPNVNELSSLVEDCTFSPAINTNRFPNTPNSAFWSGSPPEFSQAFYVVFFDRVIQTECTDERLRVRLVRDAQ